MRTLIKNGHIVTAVDSYTADILIDGETITMIGQNLSSVVGSVDKTIDATNKLVIPGGIDPHTHLDLPFGGTSSSDDFETGTYELRFHAGAYLKASGVKLDEPAFLDVIPIRFGIANSSQHYHVPLLLSPYGYSTYRGS